MTRMWLETTTLALSRYDSPWFPRWCFLKTALWPTGTVFYLDGKIIVASTQILALYTAQRQKCDNFLIATISMITLPGLCTFKSIIGLWDWKYRHFKSTENGYFGVEKQVSIVGIWVLRCKKILETQNMYSQFSCKIKLFV